MRYESEVLYDLMKRDGLLNPSQEQLPYESELKEKYVDEVKGAYPKVTDYRPEWLNYNLGYYIPADFPTESLVNVTAGTVNNVIPYAYKSAILKGNTLVNVKPKTSSSKWGDSSYDSDSGICTLNGSNSGIRFNIDLLKTSTKYLVIFDIVELPTIAVESDAPIKLALGHNSYNYLNINRDELKVGTLRKIITTHNEFTENITIGNRGEFSTPIKLRFMIVEYQQGMENWDIPYFEGMQSVKMPVLCTTGKNLYNSSDQTMKTSWWIVVEDGVPKLRKENFPTNYSVIIPAKGNTKYTYNGNNMDRNMYSFLDKDYNVLHTSYANQATITSPQDTAYVLFYLNSNDIEEVTDLQIEEGSVATSYEPYQSNILMVNEDVMLRGIGDVRDTLDCLTGEVTQRIGEMVLDGSDNFQYQYNMGTIQPNSIHVRILLDNIKGTAYKTLMNDKLPLITPRQSWGHDNYDDIGISSGTTSNQGIDIRLWRKDLATDDLNGIKEYLSKNPITIQYELATESVKTVELNSINQDGVPSTFRPFEGTMHLRTDGTPLKPTFSGEIPVEATTQNLASFVNLEGVERTVNEYVEEPTGDDNDEQLL